MSHAARTISRNTLALLTGSVLKMFFSFALVIVAAWKLGVQGFGEYELSVHYLDLFVSLIATAIGILVTREIARSSSNIQSILSSALVMVLLLTVVGAVVLLMIPGVLGYSEQSRIALSLVALALLPAAIGSFLEAVFVALEASHLVTAGTLVEGLVRVSLAMLLLFTGFGVIALVSVLIASRTCLMLFYAFRLRQRLGGWNWTFRSDTFWQLCKDWRAFAGEVGFSNLADSAGVIILSAFHSEAVVGLYFAANKVMRLGTVVAESYTNAVFPHMSRLFQTSRDSLQRLARGSLKFIFVFVLPVVVVISVFAEHVVAFLFPPEYAAAAPILRISIWLLMMRFINPFLSRLLYARGQQNHSLMAAVFGLMARLSSAFVLVPGWGAAGAACSSLITAGCRSLVYFYFVLRDGDAQSTFRVLAWASVPAGLLAIFLIALQDVQIFALLGAGALFYLSLLAIMRVVSVSDLQSLQKLMPPK